MSIREQIMQMASADPRVAQAVDLMEERLARAPIVPEDLDEAIKLLEFVLQNPEKYQEVRAAAIADGVISEGMVPPEFDQTFIVSMLVALYGLQDRLQAKGFARGGLMVAARKLQTGGQGGDTELVHVNRREAEMLRRMGGQGTVNPNTGLREYKGFKEIIGVALPVALSIIAPGVGTAIGTALGASGIGASIVGGAVIGGASSFLTGGDPLKGAAFGALGGGLGEAVGAGISEGLNLGLGETTQALLGGSLVGAGTSALTGGDPLKGAAMGAVGAGVGELASGFGAEGASAMGEGAGALGEGISQAGRTFGNALTAGYDPKTAAVAGGFAGLAGGLNAGMSPSDAVVQSLPVTGGEQIPAQSLDMGAEGVGDIYGVGDTTTVSDTGFDYGLDRVESGGALGQTDLPAAAPATQQPSMLQQLFGGQGSGNLVGTLGKLALGAGTLQSLFSAPPEVQQAVSALSPEQKEYFNRPSVQWDWNQMQRDAAASNMSLSQYMARNWPRITSGSYNKPVSTAPKMAHGGALSAVARFARGAGTGRSDEIDAKLSDGEYVMDAETVALIGDGSSKAGAEKLEQMRQQIRSHKGKALAKGKFSPNAKSPLAYLKGVA